MNTFFLVCQSYPILDPPELETALHFLGIFTHLEEEFNRIDLVNSGLFDLEHPETAQQLDLPGAIRAIKRKSQLAKEILRWVDDNQERCYQGILTEQERLLP
ncbi:MAG: hypothetical protein F6K11_04430 [Leptolyngbya sp. SIO3F4]|nr:hypothetical protein [Leptolyngbya sp. SIO3F4]